jgi:pyruvate dehydrogenase E2 component (dihydrolipoamide acetyltransferase)
LRKAMLLAAMVAMVLAAAAPAFAQAVGGSVQYVDCDQIQAAVTAQYNVGNEQNLAGVAQELGVSQQQVLACFQSVAAGRDITIGTAAPVTVTATAAAAAAAPAPAAPAAPAAAAAATPAATAAAAPAALPPTGGASLIALGASALLVTGGLLARRILR